jgi:hypothetical protein
VAVFALVDAAVVAGVDCGLVGVKALLRRQDSEL